MWLVIFCLIIVFRVENFGRMVVWLYFNFFYFNLVIFLVMVVVDNGKGGDDYVCRIFFIWFRWEFGNYVGDFKVKD